MSWLRGNHQFKFGVNVLAPMKNEYMDVPGMRGDLGFRATFTGNAVADFLLGYVSDSLLTTPYVVDQRHWATSFFVQDDWKATAKLSLNLGLRYDFITPALEAENRQANFDPADGDAGERHGRLARGPRPGEAGQEQLRSPHRHRLPGRRTAWSSGAATGSSTTCSTASAARTRSR